MQPTWITKLETHFGATLPASLAVRYMAADGERTQAEAFRLMSAEEVLWTEKQFSQDRDLLGGVPFFEDENGNFALVHLKGPLAGRVSFLEDGIASHVVYRTVDNFLNHVARLPDDDHWTEMTTDYFHLLMPFDRRQRPTTAERDADLRAATQLRALWNKVREDAAFDRGMNDEIYLRNLVVLTPVDAYESLRKYWSSPSANPFAIAWLGCVGDDAVIAPLEELVREGKQPFAYTALAWLGTEKAKQVLCSAAPTCPAGNISHLANSLKEFKIPIRHEINAKGKHRSLFQPNADALWQVIGSDHQLSRDNQPAKIVATKVNQFGLTIEIALTAAVEQEIERQTHAAKNPDKAWVRLQFIHKLSAVYGRRLSIKVTNLLPRTIIKLETPQMRLAIDAETWEEFDGEGRFGTSGWLELTYTFDYVPDEQGNYEFVWLPSRSLPGE
ncbi:hypothetical protein [Blastopirellula marina]|uniref:Uncharacterized protein n=1 Tax=Blastopirellula marina TaxID=124 RepID=A0A2S8GF22_9BACT|nr:hypothetical protein [Blastopirellula marina]PQO42684.1 hypothetical protein C5Y98_00590 [Blastopirellula marina]PTL46450.1 hypothetical protein C5Y97_00590 [Blastopirellula marina]